VTTRGTGARSLPGACFPPASAGTDGLDPRGCDISGGQMRTRRASTTVARTSRASVLLLVVERIARAAARGTTSQVRTQPARRWGRSPSTIVAGHYNYIGGEPKIRVQTHPSPRSSSSTDCGRLARPQLRLFEGGGVCKAARRPLTARPRPREWSRRSRTSDLSDQVRIDTQRYESPSGGSTAGRDQRSDGSPPAMASARSARVDLRTAGEEGGGTADLPMTRPCVAKTVNATTCSARSARGWDQSE
jgi:hypothetical protein